MSWPELQEPLAHLPDYLSSHFLLTVAAPQMRQQFELRILTDSVFRPTDFDARFATLESGIWKKGAVGAGARSDSILAEAMLAYFEDEEKTETKDGVPINAAWVRGFLLAEDVDDAKAKDVRSARAKSWKANDGVKVHYDRIRAEREAKKVSKVEAADTSDI